MKLDSGDNIIVIHGFVYRYGLILFRRPFDHCFVSIDSCLGLSLVFNVTTKALLNRHDELQ